MISSIRVQTRLKLILHGYEVRTEKREHAVRVHTMLTTTCVLYFTILSQFIVHILKRHRVFSVIKPTETTAEYEKYNICSVLLHARMA